MKATRRVALPVGDPPLYVLVSEAEPSRQRFGPAWAKDGTQIAAVHVMSPASGGECRGYWLIAGVLWRRYPDMIGDWPEVDQAVADALGLEVRDRVAEGARGWRDSVLAMPRAQASLPVVER